MDKQILSYKIICIFLLVMTITSFDSFTQGINGGEIEGKQIQTIKRDIKYEESIAWEAIDSSIYSYDDQERPIQVLGLMLEEDTWMKLDRTSYSYEKDKEIEEFASYTNGDWDINSRHISDFFNEKLATQTNQFKLDGNLENDNRHFFEYDEQGNMILSLTQYWLDNEWQNECRVLTVFDTINGTEYRSIEEWDENNWRIVDEVLIEVIDLDSSETTIYKNWKYGSLVLEQETIIIFDAFNNAVSETFYRISGSSRSIISKRNFTYNENGFLTSEIYKNKEGNFLKNNTKIEFLYNESNQLITIQRFNWELLDWSLLSLTEYLYTESGNLREINYGYFSQEGVFQDVLNPDYHFEYNTEDLLILKTTYNETESRSGIDILERIKTYYFNPLTVSTKEIALTKVAPILFPNPASTYLKVETNSLSNKLFTSASIFSIKGEFIRSLTINNISQTIPIANLNNGTYILQLASNNSLITQVFIVEK